MPFLNIFTPQNPWTFLVSYILNLDIYLKATYYLYKSWLHAHGSSPRSTIQSIPHKMNLHQTTGPRSPYQLSSIYLPHNINPRTSQRHPPSHPEYRHQHHEPTTNAEHHLNEIKKYKICLSLLQSEAKDETRRD